MLALENKRWVLIFLDMITYTLLKGLFLPIFNAFKEKLDLKIVFFDLGEILLCNLIFGNEKLVFFKEFLFIHRRDCIKKFLLQENKEFLNYMGL